MKNIFSKKKKKKKKKIIFKRMLLDDIKLVNNEPIISKCTFPQPLKNVRKWFSDVFRGYGNEHWLDKG